MAFRRYVIAVLVFVAVVGIAFATIQIADSGRDDAARTPEMVTNESISQQVSIWQFVGEALDDDTAGFNESVTVYNASGAELEKGVDYRWNATDGTITYENTQNVTDGAIGNISYTYFKNTQEVNELAKIIGPLVVLASHGPLLAGGLALGILLLAAVGILAKYTADSGPKKNR